MKTMKIYNVALALGLGTLGVVAQAMAAQAVDFNFSFTGTSGVTGTVTGLIGGLTDNTSSVPSSIIINTDPTGVPSGTILSQYLGGSFTVSNDTITAANDVIFEDSNSNFAIIFNLSSTNILSNLTDGSYTSNSDEFSGVTYIPTATVPEPNEKGLIAFGIPLFLALGIINKRKALKFK